MTAGYEKHIEYRFEAGPWKTGWAIISEESHDGRRVLVISETRKNGQEDCHMMAEAHEQPDGTWKLEEDSMIAEYESARTVTAIEAYLNEHGAPVWE